MLFITNRCPAVVMCTHNFFNLLMAPHCGGSGPVRTFEPRFLHAPIRACQMQLDRERGQADALAHEREQLDCSWTNQTWLAGTGWQTSHAYQEHADGLDMKRSRLTDFARRKSGGMHMTPRGSVAVTPTQVWHGKQQEVACPSKARAKHATSEVAASTTRTWTCLCIDQAACTSTTCVAVLGS
jgi:hypothetical protein